MVTKKKQAHKDRIKKGNNTALTLPGMSNLATQSKFTEEIAIRILDLLEMGIGIEASAYQVGLDPSTVYNWRKGTKEPFLTFSALVDKALTQKEIYLVGKLYQAFNEDCVKTAPIIQRHLERHLPNKYGPNEQTNVFIQNNTIDPSNLSLDEKKKLLELKLKMLGQGTTEEPEDAEYIDIEVDTNPHTLDPGPPGEVDPEVDPT